MVPKLEALIKKANGGREVTAAILKKSGRVKVSTKVMRKRLSEQEGVDWYAMRLKPNLTRKISKTGTCYIEMETYRETLNVH